MKISLVLPFHNEEALLPSTVKTLVEVLTPLGLDFDLILVDDGSGDKTWPTIEFLADSHKESGEPGSIRGLSLSRNFGKEAAICAGLDAADGDCVIVMDGDLQHPPSLLPDMISAWKDEGYDLVEAVKSGRKNDGLFQRMTASVFYFFFRKTSGYDLKNASDYKLLDRKVLLEWRRFGESNTFFRGLTAWMGFSRKTLEFEVAKRQAGRSKWRVRNLLGLSVNAITSFSALPLQIVTFFGAVFLVFALGLGIQTLVNWFSGRAADGFTTVILLLLFIGGAIMTSLGLIGIYIGKIFNEVKGRPRYMIGDRTDIKQK